MNTILEIAMTLSPEEVEKTIHLLSEQYYQDVTLVATKTTCDQIVELVKQCEENQYVNVATRQIINITSKNYDLYVWYKSIKVAVPYKHSSMYSRVITHLLSKRPQNTSVDIFQNYVD